MKTQPEPEYRHGSPARVGVLLANLGTPDGTDYRSMRRYLGEFLSDRRVIDYSPWIWQPLRFESLLIVPALALLVLFSARSFSAFWPFFP